MHTIYSGIHVSGVLESTPSFWTGFSQGFLVRHSKNVTFHSTSENEMLSLLFLKRKRRAQLCSFQWCTLGSWLLHSWSSKMLLGLIFCWICSLTWSIVGSDDCQPYCRKGNCNFLLLSPLLIKYTWIARTSVLVTGDLAWWRLANTLLTRWH